MEKIRLKNIKLSKEIMKYATTKKNEMNNISINIFLSKILYNGFKIILVHPIISQKAENHYYRRSKYGWWTFCAKKNELDVTDEELIKNKHPANYGLQQTPEGDNCEFYREDDHTFCNDNMRGGKYFYNLHPNGMVKLIKEGINKFYKFKVEMTKDAGRKKE